MRLIHFHIILGTLFQYGLIYGFQDFRNVQDIFLSTLKELCSLAQESVTNNIMAFLSSTMFVNQMMSPIQFDNEINNAIERFKNKLPIEFGQTLDIIRTSIQGNALIGIFSTNWQFVVVEKGQGRNASFRSEPVSYFDFEQNTTCSCATSRTCTMPAQIFYSNGTPFYTSESLVLGCNSLETVLHSSLSCFYSLSCINDLRVQGLRLHPFSNFIPFNASLTRFNLNDTIEKLANEMFIESWINNKSYERFFNSCSPSSCTYKYYYRFDKMEVFTTFLSVYAGLSLGIHFITPYLVRIIKKFRNRFRIVPLLNA